MLKIIFTPPNSGDELERHARYLHHEAVRKEKLPRVAAATRALVPTWCDICAERCWGTPVGYSMCARCRGEGKKPIGFGD